MMKTTSVSNYDALGLLGVLVYLFSVSLASSPSFWFVFLLRIIAVSVSDNRCMFLFFIGTFFLLNVNEVGASSLVPLLDVAAECEEVIDAEVWEFLQQIFKRAYN